MASVKQFFVTPIIPIKTQSANRKAFGLVVKNVCSPQNVCSRAAGPKQRQAAEWLWHFNRDSRFFTSVSLSSSSRKCTASPLPRLLGLLSVCFRLWSNMHDSSPSKPGQCVSEECWQECTIARSRGNTHPHGLQLTVLLLSSSYKDMRLLDSMNS